MPLEQPAQAPEQGCKTTQAELPESSFQFCWTQGKTGLVALLFWYKMNSKY